MPTITDEIKTLIEHQLPAQVGSVLRKRLEAADAAEAKVAALENAGRADKKQIEELTAIIKTLSAREVSLHEIQKREQELREREHALAIREAEQTIRKDMTLQMLDRDFAIVQAVFANNRIKYQESRTDGHAFPVAATASNPYPCPQTAMTDSTRTVVVEGG